MLHRATDAVARPRETLAVLLRLVDDVTGVDHEPIGDDAVLVWILVEAVQWYVCTCCRRV